MTETAQENLPLVHALGVSHTGFDPTSPGRLCRGRERWIEPYDVEEPPGELHRVVISGAAFVDDSARDALRGLPHSQLELAAVIDALFPERDLMAFMEDGHPADMPDDPEGLELYTGYRSGGHSEEMRVRWYKRVRGLEAIREMIGTDVYDEKVRGFVVLEGGEDLEEIWERLFLLVGMSTLDSPPARFNPAALPEVLEVAPTLVLIHRDKHGPALGLYSREPVETEAPLAPVCDASGSLLVPFAIPPMLARWDRALAELKQVWLQERDEDFPVPPSPEPSGWEPRWKRRQRKKADARARKQVAAESGDEE